MWNQTIRQIRMLWGSPHKCTSTTTTRWMNECRLTASQDRIGYYINSSATHAIHDTTKGGTSRLNLFIANDSGQQFINYFLQSQSVKSPGSGSPTWAEQFLPKDLPQALEHNSTLTYPSSLRYYTCFGFPSLHHHHHNILSVHSQLSLSAMKE